jgi:hypothetical protein
VVMGPCFRRDDVGRDARDKLTFTLPAAV